MELNTLCTATDCVDSVVGIGIAITDADGVASFVDNGVENGASDVGVFERETTRFDRIPPIGKDKIHVHPFDSKNIFEPTPPIENEGTLHRISPIEDAMEMDWELN